MNFDDYVDRLDSDKSWVRINYGLDNGVKTKQKEGRIIPVSKIAGIAVLCAAEIGDSHMSTGLHKRWLTNQSYH